MGISFTGSDLLYKSVAEGVTDFITTLQSQRLHHFNIKLAARLPISTAKFVPRSHG